MADGTAKPVIFISYSHKDRAWLDYVRSFFEPLATHWNLQIWDDQKLRIGDDWRGDIYSAVDACRVFIVLVSRYALASTFIATEEVGRSGSDPRARSSFARSS
jgi:TIR domain